MKSNRITRMLAFLLAFTLAGALDMAQAIQNPTPAQNTAPAQTTPQTTTPAADDTKKPADTTPTPAATQELPNAPSAEPGQSQQNTSSSTSQDKQPLGTAAAEKGETRGGAASRPAGTALAGVKQKQSRGLLIKLGLVAAAGVAVGTVYALSRSTGPVPPGAVR